MQELTIPFSIVGETRHRCRLRRRGDPSTSQEGQNRSLVIERHHQKTVRVIGRQAQEARLRHRRSDWEEETRKEGWFEEIVLIFRRGFTSLFVLLWMSMVYQVTNSFAWSRLSFSIRQPVRIVSAWSPSCDSVPQLKHGTKPVTRYRTRSTSACVLEPRIRKVKCSRVRNVLADIDQLIAGVATKKQDIVHTRNSGSNGKALECEIRQEVKIMKQDGHRGALYPLSYQVVWGRGNGLDQEAREVESNLKFSPNLTVQCTSVNRQPVSNMQVVPLSRRQDATRLSVPGRPDQAH